MHTHVSLTRLTTARTFRLARTNLIITIVLYVPLLVLVVMD